MHMQKRTNLILMENNWHKQPRIFDLEATISKRTSAHCQALPSTQQEMAAFSDGSDVIVGSSNNDNLGSIGILGS